MFFGRGPNKVKGCYTLKHIYDSYIAGVEVNSPYYVDYKTFVSITTTYLKGIGDYLLETSLPFRLPHRLGSFRVVKKKINFLYQNKNYMGSIDWAASVKVGKQVFYTNDHTGGYKYLFFWDRSNCKINNLSKYRFIPCRTFKRRLASLLKNNIKDYLEYK